MVGWIFLAGLPWTESLMDLPWVGCTDLELVMAQAKVSLSIPLVEGRGAFWDA